MRYVSDSKREKRNKKSKRPVVKRPKAHPKLPTTGSPDRAIHEAPELPIDKPTVIEREGVKVNISAAVKRAHRGNKIPKKPIDRDKVSSIIIKVLIGFGIAVALTLVMVMVYYFATQSTDTQPQAEEVEGYPALVGGINIEAPPATVASLSPLLTNMVKTLPLGDPLIAVSEYCENDNNLPVVGTPLLPDVDSLIELGPEYLITLTPLTIQQKISLEQVGITVLEFAAPTTVGGFSDLASELATLFLGDEQGVAVASAIYGRFSNALAQYSTAVDRPVEERPSYSLMFDLSGFSATPDTIEAQIFTSVLGRAAVEGQGYATTMQDILDADPEIIILPDTLTFADLEGTGLELGSAAQNNMIFFIDMKNVETYNPLLLFDLAEIANHVYPELTIGS